MVSSPIQSAPMEDIPLYIPISDCRICRGRDLRQVLDLGEQALTGIFPKSRDTVVPGGPLTLVRCNDCGLVQLAHNYDLERLYGANYGYRSGLNSSMVRHLHGIVAELERRYRLRDNDLIIDIGSNDGTLLRGYSTPNIRRIGIDPTASKFRKYYPDGCELIVDFFSAEAISAVAPGIKARVISSIAMFYDLERPTEFVEDIAKLLAEDGVWVFEQSYLPAMIEKKSYDTICHEHLEYYTLEQIDKLLIPLGLKIVDVDFNDVNGGSFRVTAALNSAPYAAIDDRVAEVRTKEKAAGFNSIEPFQRLEHSMIEHREGLLELLGDLRRRGKLVLGYGASTKGNVLLQYCRITSDLLPAIAEVNEDKFGAFTPGTRIPIISEAEARRMNPDYFLVLPWHFRDNIVAKEEKYLRDGGKLIFPLPDLTVI